MGLLKMMQKLHPDNVIVNGRGNGVVGVHLVNQAHQPCRGKGFLSLFGTA